MLHWLYDPKRKIRRFAEENAKAKPEASNDPLVLHIMDLATNNGMRPSDVESLAEELDPLKLGAPSDNNAKFDYIHYIMNVLLDDLNFDAAEKDFLKELAVEIGIPVEKAPYLIRALYEGLKTETSLSEIKGSFFEVLAK